MSSCRFKWLAIALLAGGLFWAFDFANAGGDNKADPAKKADDAKQKADEAKKKADDVRKDADRRAEEAKKKLEATKQDAAKAKIDGAKKLEEAKKAAETRKADDAKRMEEAKKRAEESKKAFEEQAKKRADDQAKYKAAEAEAKKKAAAAKTLDDLPKDKDGYALLLGKDFGNWYLGYDSKVTLEGKTEAGEKNYQVANDVLVLESGGTKQVKTLRNVKQLNKRYSMKFDFRADKDGAAGFSLGNYGFTLRDLTKSPQVRPLKNFKVGEWNSIEITIEPGTYSAHLEHKPLTDKDVVELVVKEGRPTVTVNGKTVEPASFQLQRSQPIVLVKCNGEDALKGHVQSFGNELNSQVSVRADAGKVEIRNLRVKEIN